MGAELRPALPPVVIVTLLALSLCGLSGDSGRMPALAAPDSLVLGTVSIAGGAVSRKTGDEVVPVRVGGAPDTGLELVFDVVGLPRTTRSLRASVEVTLGGGRRDAALSIVGGRASPTEPAAGRDRAPVDSGAPREGLSTVELDVSEVVTGEGRYSFTVTSASPSPSVVTVDGAGAPVMRLNYRRHGPPAAARPERWPPGRHSAPATTSAPDADGCVVSALLVPSCGGWLGVTPGAFSGRPLQESMADFERVIGQTVDVVHAFHRAGELFPTPEEVGVASEPGRRRLLFLNYKPEGGHTWAQVADGWMDPELDRLAAHMRRTWREPFFFTVHHEPEEEVSDTPGSGYTADDYAAMFRHVVERLRAQGVVNAVRVFDVMGTAKYVPREWFDRLYPGDDVVDWVAWNPYACVDPGQPCGGYAELVNRTWLPDWSGFYDHARAHYPNKPLMLAEWGVVHNGPPARTAAVFESVARNLGAFPEIKALVYFDAADSPVGETRVDSSPAALAAFRRLASSPWFGQRPPG